MIYCQDSTKLIPELVGTCRIVFADPPYNQGVRYADDRTNDRLSFIEYEHFCEDVIQVGSKYLVDGGMFWWLGPESHIDFIPDLMRRNKLFKHYYIIKEESFSQYNQYDLTLDFRVLFAFGNRIDYYKNLDSIRVTSMRQAMGDARANDSGRIPGRIWSFRRLQGTSIDRVDWHPAQLPPELLTRIVSGWSKPGDTILDMFAGSGSLIKVAKQLDRVPIGIEKSVTYCNYLRDQ